MRKLAYERHVPPDPVVRDLSALSFWFRLTAGMAACNGLGPWTLGTLVASVLDFALQSPVRRWHLVVPPDHAPLAVLTSVMLSLAGLSWWSARLIDQRRQRPASIAVGLLLLPYMPFGTIVAVRTLRLLCFRGDIRAAYVASRERGST